MIRNRKKRRDLEGRLVRSVASYLKHKHPGVKFRFDISADLPMASYKAKNLIMKFKHQSKYPDLFIARPSIMGSNIYAGLYLELKSSYSKVFKVNGDLKKDNHLEGQRKMLKELQADGYCAMFAYPDDEMVYHTIDSYLKGFDIYKAIMLDCKKK